MTKKGLINKTVNTLNQLPQNKITEVCDFADYLLKKYEEETLRKGLKTLVNKSQTFDFLEEEEELYSTKDLKEKY